MVSMEFLFRHPEIKRVQVSIDAEGMTQLVAGVPGRRIVLIGFGLWAAQAVNVSFCCNGLTAGPIRVLPSGGIHIEQRSGIAESDTGEGIALDLSTDVAVTGWITYIEYEV